MRQPCRTSPTIVERGGSACVNDQRKTFGVALTVRGLDGAGDRTEIHQSNNINYTTGVRSKRRRKSGDEANESFKKLIIIELWYGNILDENDIERFEDIYERI